MPASPGGDSLRTAFDTINYNFDLLSKALRPGNSEVVYHAGNTNGQITANASSGTIHLYTVNQDFTFNPPVMEAGDHMTFIFKQDSQGNHRLICTATNILFPGGTCQLSTSSNAIDFVKTLYDGSLYYTTIDYNFNPVVAPPAMISCDNAPNATQYLNLTGKFIVKVDGVAMNDGTPVDQTGLLQLLSSNSNLGVIAEEEVVASPPPGI